MASVRRYLLIAASFVLALAAFTVLAPKTVHAIGAALVQVANSNSNPVPTQLDGRNVVRLTLDVTLPPGTLESNGNGPGGILPLKDVLTGQPYTVPAGRRLVIDSMSAFAYAEAGQSVYLYLLNGTNPFGNFTAIPMVAQGTFPFNQVVYEGIGPKTDYVDQNQQYFVSLHRNDSNGSAEYNVNATGHLVDCTNGGGC